MNTHTFIPGQADVDALRDLLDLMANFSDDDQGARDLLSSNWLRDRGAIASTRLSVVKIGRRRLVPGEALTKDVAGLERREEAAFNLGREIGPCCMKSSASSRSPHM